MQIEVKCFATLTRFTPQDAQQHEVPDGATVRRVLEDLSIPLNEAKLIFINGAHADLDKELAPGDRLGVFPPVGGG